MNKKLLDNYDKMVVKDKVAVIHCAFGDTPHTVAFVHVDKDLLEKAARETGTIVTCEEHNIMGGFGSSVSEVVSESYPVPIRRIGVHDKFGESARDNEIPQLFEKHGITAINIANTVKEARGQKQ